MLKSDISSEDKLKTILDFDKVLGLNLDKIKKEKIPEIVYDLLKQREDARKNKDWKKSDELRDEIKALGFDVEDTKDGAIIKSL